MGRYENGIATRQAILSACKKLFLEKGFHETSSSDICREAHVNRNAIYYHFKDLENIRYEVLWEMLLKNRLAAREHGVEVPYLTLVGTCMSWCQHQNDPKRRKFCLDYCRDHPFYSPNSNFSMYHSMVWKDVGNELLHVPMMDPIRLASLYGYITSLLVASAAEGIAQSGIELSVLCTESVLTIWGIEKEKINEVISGLRRNMEKIPEELLQA